MRGISGDFGRKVTVGGVNIDLGGQGTGGDRCQLRTDIFHFFYIAGVIFSGNIDGLVPEQTGETNIGAERVEV